MTPVTPISASAVLDSIGINIHAGYNDTLYGQWDVIVQALADLGIKHVRDGSPSPPSLQFVARHRQLAGMGIRALMIADPKWTADAFNLYPGLFPTGDVEAFETLNEADATGDGWIARLIASLAAAKSGNPTKLPVVGPSLGLMSYPVLGDVSKFSSVGNIHCYTANRYPETPGYYGGVDPATKKGFPDYGSLSRALKQVALTNPGQAVWATETGYNNNRVVPKGQRTYNVPEGAASIYLPRLLLYFYMCGVQRTYIYELASEMPTVGNGEDFGLIRWDGKTVRRKPAFDAVRNLLALLRSTPDIPVPMTPLAYQLDGPDVMHMLMQRDDGAYLMALWRDVSVWDQDNQTGVQNGPVRVKLTIPGLVTGMVSHQWAADGSIKVRHPAINLFDVNADMLVLEFRTAGA